MQTFTRGLSIALLCFLTICLTPVVHGQSILNPNDTVYTFGKIDTPAQPAWNTIGKWARTVRLAWNTTNFKCYIFNTYPFRLRYPKSYNPNANDGKVYPILIFMHGEGEGGGTYDNEYQLFHGGQVFDTAVSNGDFDGYVLCLQTPNGFWGEPVYTYLTQILDYMVANNKLDPFRINLNGLSAGGEGVWEFLFDHTTYVAGTVPMSYSQLSYVGDTGIVKWTPMHLVQGGLDGSPDPGTTQTVVNAINAAGGNLTYTVFPKDGHDTWDDTWNQTWFWPTINSTYASNPWALFGHNQFCTGQTVNAVLGVAAGYQAYQWRRNDTLITSATSNSIVASQLGTYDCRIERNNIWSDWSHVPVVVSILQPTVTPPITIPPLRSNAIPALDTSKGVPLSIPAGYASYQWQMLGGGSNLGSTDTLYVTTPGQYEAMVTQNFGCSSSWSNPYTVINANGPNGPATPAGLTVTPLSNTSQRLDWTVNPGQTYPQTGFEVYQGIQTGGPYKIIALLGAGAVHDTITGLEPGTKYYYVLRAVNGNAASKGSNEANAATFSDTIPPTAPTNLAVTGTTHSSVSLQWTAATDNVGVTSYDIYVNGVKNYSTTATTYTINNLQYPTSYAFSVVARDFAGNKSPFSNQVTSEPLTAGLLAQYYVLSAPTALPNYSTLVPALSGASTTGISAALFAQYPNIGVLWQGWLHITTAGSYQFSTTSVDGSAVYLGPLNGTNLAYSFPGSPIVNNDGIHSSKTVTSATMNLAVGTYPIAVAYFIGSNGPAAITVQWTTPSSGTFVSIPASAFADVNVVQGTTPAAPTNLVATAQSYSSIGLTWTDNANNETGYEIWRSATSATTGFVTVGTVGTGVTAFTDKNLTANTTYYYEVRAINQYGASAYTAVASTPTQALPAAPAAPSGFISEGTSTTSTVGMSWTNNATNATSIQVYRSVGNDLNYLLLATLASTATSYTDKGLFDNSVYYYKVQAINLGGSSGFSNEDSAHTKDRLPTIKPINPVQYMRYGTTLTLNVNASDSDGSALNVQVTNLPTFGAYTSTGNGTGTITFTNPTVGQQGIYNTITVTVTDPQGGQAVDTFNLTVNNDYAPAITRPVSNVTLNEKATASMLLAATEQNPADVLTWSFTGMPGFVTTTPSVTGDSLTLSMAPGYADGGTYTVHAMVSNQNHLFDSVTFIITVNTVTLPTVSTYVHFDGVPGSNGASPWNNWNTQPAQNVSVSNLKDQNGSNTGVSLTITTAWQNISYGTGSNVLGQTTGNNSGVYPDSVLYSGYYTDGNAQNITIAGLDTSTKYNFTFFGSRGSVNDDRTSVYSLSGTYVNQSVSLNAASNTANTVSINSVRPNADGTLKMTLAKGASAPFGYLNALVITKQYNDHTAPAAPRSLSGTIVNGTELSLTWVAAAYNANSYQVYRSTSQAGPYTLLNPGATNPTQASYVDTGLLQNTTYYYIVTATNSYGVSPGDSLMVAVPNLAPVLTPVAPITLGAGQTSVTNVAATDPGDVITLTVSGLPAFANFVDNGNGTGVLTLSPQVSDMGSYTGTLTATDQHGASSTTPLNITVSLANLRNVYVHFNDPTGGEPAAPTPWNNTNSAPNAGYTLSHLVDDHGTTTNFNLVLASAWTGSNNIGPNTGNNSGVYPDVVEESFYYDNSGAARVVNLTGLSPNKQYNVIFYAGRGGVTDNRITHYAIGSQSVALNAASNTQNTVQIDGVSPDVTGTISISVTPDAGSPFAYINALQLQYSYDTSFAAPSPLTTAGPTASAIQLTWPNNAPAITTGFEIWRGSTPTGPFSLLTTVGGTVTTYTDGGLTQGTSYFYEVRADAGTRTSAFSNVAGGSTVANTVQIQFNDGSTLKAEGGNWNSTNTLIYPGFQLPNMINTNGAPTGMNLNIIDNFEGFNDLGATTGNNSGIFPDKVMQGFFYNDFGMTAVLSVTGLDYTSTYNFNFFGSRANPATNVVSTYQIGNQIVTQDATNNTSKTVQIAGVKPDSTGTITFSVYNTEGGRCYLNALTIDIVPNPINNFGNTPVATQVTTDAVSGTSNRFNNGQSETQAALIAQTSVTAFPDPFIDAISLNLHLPTAVNKLLVSVVDAKGVVLLRQELDNLPQGVSVVPLGINGSRMPVGTYYLLIQGLPGGKSLSLPLVKMTR